MGQFLNQLFWHFEKFGKKFKHNQSLNKRSISLHRLFRGRKKNTFSFFAKLLPAPTKERCVTGLSF